jgi:hypothetical protein
MRKLITRDVLRATGAPYHKVFALIQSGRIPTPERDSSGRYSWDEALLEQVKHALADYRPRPRKAVSA